MEITAKVWLFIGPGHLVFSGRQFFIGPSISKHIILRFQSLLSGQNTCGLLAFVYARASRHRPALQPEYNLYLMWVMITIFPKQNICVGSVPVNETIRFPNHILMWMLLSRDKLYIYCNAQHIDMNINMSLQEIFFFRLLKIYLPCFLYVTISKVLWKLAVRFNIYFFSKDPAVIDKKGVDYKLLQDPLPAVHGPL